MLECLHQLPMESHKYINKGGKKSHGCSSGPYEDLFGSSDHITESFLNYRNYDYSTSEAVARAEQEIEDEITSMHLNSSGGHLSEAENEVLAGILQDLENQFANVSTVEASYFPRGESSSSSIPMGVRMTDYSPPRISRFRQPRHDNVDPDNMTYEQLTQLGQSIGSEKKGLSAEKISRLPFHAFNPSTNRKNSSADSECVICKVEYKRGDSVLTLPCSHRYHKQCIQKWLEDNKNCCMCKREVVV